MTAPFHELRVVTVRSRGRHGGVIFTGMTDDNDTYVASCSFHQISDSSLVQKGQRWLVEGPVQNRRITTRNGQVAFERQIEATRAELLRPSGKNLVSWIAECPDCQGVGVVKASKLYSRFGPELAQHIEAQNLHELCKVVSLPIAESLCNAFRKHAVASVLVWLDAFAIPRVIGAKVLGFYKDRTREKVEENPYVLLSFEANWFVVDDMATKRFGIVEDDPRRLEAAIEESLYRCLKNGNTCLPESELRRSLKGVLGSRELVDKALEASDVSSQYVRAGDRFQPTGMFLIERYLAERFSQLAVGENACGQLSLFATAGSNPAAIAHLTSNYEQANAVLLTEEQRAAVLGCASSSLFMILGGAGTGKTTVLKAVYSIVNSVQPGTPIYQLALAGRAAQRMNEATGLESMTIAAFLTRFRSSDIELGSVVVVDEVSMIDVVLMYRLLKHLPNGVRLILVGDPSQLPPIGPGLVLHALADITSIPRIELTVVKRQSSASGIPQVAAAIRRHELPMWKEYSGRGTSVSFVPCVEAKIDDLVGQLYEELGGDGSNSDVQVLAVTRNGNGGVIGLNALFHGRYHRDAECISYVDVEFGRVNARTLDRLSIRVGDLVMFTENDYDLGLRNGALGTVTRAFDATAPDDVCCLCTFEGREYALSAKQLQALTHAYAITVHKSQGSQFKRVIVPLRASRLLDQTLIYTAVTRGVEQVILVGDYDAACSAIRAPASATRRHVTLPTLFQEAAMATTFALRESIQSGGLSSPPWNKCGEAAFMPRKGLD